MIDDIVTRLRERGEWDSHPMGGREWFPDELCQDAADEIVHLRSTIELMKRVIPTELLAQFEEGDDD